MFYYQEKKKSTNKSRKKAFKTAAMIFHWIMLLVTAFLSGMGTFLAFLTGMQMFISAKFIAIIIFSALIGNFAIVSVIFAQRAKAHPEEDEAIAEETGDDEESRKIRAYSILYPKITLTQLAKKSGVPDEEIEDKLVDLQVNRKIRGHIDPGTREFISGSVNHSIIVDGSAGPDAFLCPFCKSSIGSPPVKGTTLKCESCGNLIVM
ncbi:MAG: PCI domain-containing protein [Candidatus Hodarchaeota archaeon]